MNPLQNLNRSYTIRFVKLPRAVLRPDKPFEIAFSITDDLGLELVGHPDLLISVSLQQDAAQASGLPLAVRCSDTNNTNFVAASGHNPVHKRTLVVRYSDKPSRHVTRPGCFHLILSLEKPAGFLPLKPEELQDPLERQLINAVAGANLVTMPEVGVLSILLPARTGPLMLAEAGHIKSYSKIATTEVLLKWESPLRVIERPLDHNIGDHLWHSSIILANYLISTADPSSDAERLVVELGAGCGLVSLALASTAQHYCKATIVATDLPEVVSSTLQDTMQANKNVSALIRQLSLIWGSDKDAQELLRRHAKSSIEIVAADVLYNPENHQSLLKTIIALTSPFSTRTLTIAYRPRTVGDDAFFAEAAAKGLPFQHIYSSTGVRIWRHRSNTLPVSRDLKAA